MDLRWISDGSQANIFNENTLVPTSAMHRGLRSSIKKIESCSTFRSLGCFPGIADGFQVYGNTHLRCFGDDLSVFLFHVA